MVLLFTVFIILLLISASPLLGCYNISWSLPVMLGLFAAMAVLGMVVFICYPLFS